jgi:hypothetical protein
VNDDRLRQLFAELRRAETERAPRFEATALAGRNRLNPQLHLRRMSFAAVLLILVALAFLPMLRRPTQPSITAWKAPTDFLLVTPGRELLHSTPELRGSRQ